MVFQSTRPRGARQSKHNVRLSVVLFQSTRPRGARLGKDTLDKAGIPVSIHAPAGGATKYLPASSRRRLVSIHAPAGGATLPATQITLSLRGFNPRARGGRDIMARMCRPRANQFQSTRPRGARRGVNGLRPKDAEVSIHAPAGGATIRASRTGQEGFVSIHAPAGGATVHP